MPKTMGTAASLFSSKLSTKELVAAVVAIRFLSGLVPFVELAAFSPILPAILRTTSCHVTRFRAFFVLKPIYSVSSFTCSFFGFLRFLLTLTSRSKAILKTLLPSLLTFRPYHLTLLAYANQSTVYFYPRILVCC